MRSRTAGLLLCCLTVAGCSGSGGSTPSTPKPTPQVLRALETCPSTVTAPGTVAYVVPDASTPPTAVLSNGEAVSFTVPAGAVLGVVGVAGSTAGAVVCRAAGPATTATLVAVGPGYARVAIAAQGQVRTTAASKRLFVKVTG